MLTTEKRPYEFLVRWRKGVISGAHVGFELTTLEDGKEINTTPLDVMAVDIGNGQGFPLKEILDQLHIDALSQIDTLNGSLKSKSVEIDELNSSLKSLQEISDRQQAEIEALQQEKTKPS